MATNIKKKKVSELPEATDTNNFWIFGSKTVGGVATSVKFAFDKITSLFGVTQETGQSITLAPSQKLFTDEIDKVEKALGKEGGGTETEIMAFSNVTANISSIPGGQWFYENYELLYGKYISKVKINIETAGIFSVIVGRNIKTNNYSFEAIPFSVVKGVNVLTINRKLQPNESIGFQNYTDTAKFYFRDENTTNVRGGGFFQREQNNTIKTVLQYDLSIGIYVSEGGELGTNFVKKIDLERNYSSSTETAPASELLNQLHSQLYEGEGADIVEKEIIPLVNGLQNSVVGQWFYKNQNLFKGAKITKIRLNFGTTGKFTINVGLGTVSVGITSIVSRQEYTISQTGEQIITLNSSITLTEGQILGFGDYSDTAFFKCGVQPTASNPVGGTFYLLNQNGTWGTVQNDELGISVIGETVDANGDIPLIKKRIYKLETNDINMDLQLKGKTFSLLGDSISTYRGMIPSGHPYTYPNAQSGISSYLQTWWGLLVDKYKMLLKANASWSGGTICGTGNGSLPNYISKLGDSPEFIFIFGGTNDYGTQKKIGEFNFYQTQDRNIYKQALCYMFDTMRSAYPNSRIIFMTSMQRNYATQSNGKFPNKITDAMPFQYEYNDAAKETCKIYGVEVVDMYNCGINWVNMDTYLYDRIHPNAAGMALITDFLYKNIVK